MMLDRQPGYLASLSFRARAAIALGVATALIGASALLLTGTSASGKSALTQAIPAAATTAAATPVADSSSTPVLSAADEAPSTSSGEAQTPGTAESSSASKASVASHQVGALSSPPNPPGASAAAKAAMSSRPKTLVAASVRNRVVVIDPVTGKTTKVLISFEGQQNVSLGGVAVSPDGSTAYFVKVIQGISGGLRLEIWKISVKGGVAHKVADGEAPSLSVDGTKLAYINTVNSTNANADYQTDLHVLTLATGVDSFVRNVDGCNCGSDTVTWAPDNHHLAFQINNCGCGGQSYENVQIIDTATPNAPIVTVPNPSALGRPMWGLGNYLPDGNLFLTKEPSFDFNNGMMVSQGQAQMDIVNALTGAVVRTIATGFVDRNYSNATSDATGSHLFYLSNADLMVSDNGSGPVKLATGITSAAW